MTFLTGFVAALFVKPTSRSDSETFYNEKDLLLRGLPSRCLGSVVASCLFPRPLWTTPSTVSFNFSRAASCPVSLKEALAVVASQIPRRSLWFWITDSISFLNFRVSALLLRVLLLILNSSNSFQMKNLFQKPLDIHSWIPKCFSNVQGYLGFLNSLQEFAQYYVVSLDSHGYAFISKHCDSPKQFRKISAGCWTLLASWPRSITGFSVNVFRKTVFTFHSFFYSSVSARLKSIGDFWRRCLDHRSLRFENFLVFDFLNQFVISFHFAVLVLFSRILSVTLTEDLFTNNWRMRIGFNFQLPHVLVNFYLTLFNSFIALTLRDLCQY